MRSYASYRVISAGLSTRPLLAVAFLAILLIPKPLAAQGVVVSPKVVLSTVNGITRPVQATVTVCAANVAGLPCSPALANTLFKDAALTQPLANPFTTDANGNYNFGIAGGNYTVTETAAGFAGYSYQLTVSCSPGPCTVTSLTVTSTLTVNGASSLAGPTTLGGNNIASTIGPSAGQQHVLPAVASANIAVLPTVTTTETGSGAVVKATSPGITTPIITGSATNAQGGNFGTPTMWGCTGAPTAAATNYLTNGGVCALGLGYEIPLGAGLYQGLRCFANAGGVNASDGVITVQKNAVDTTITATLGTGISANDLAHTFTTASGDRIRIKVVTQAATTLSGITCSLEKL